MLAASALSGDVANYTKDVEAFMRVTSRKGLKHKPMNTLEVMLLDHEQRERQIKALEGIEDALRLQVGCSLLLSFLRFRLLHIRWGFLPSIDQRGNLSPSCAHSEYFRLVFGVRWGDMFGFRVLRRGGGGLLT